MENIQDGIRLEGENTEISFAKKEVKNQVVEAPKVLAENADSIEKLKNENELLKKDIEKLKSNIKILPDGTIVVNGNAGNDNDVAMYENKISDLNIIIKKKETEISRLNNVIESINKSKEDLVNSINSMENEKERLLNTIDSQDQKAKAEIEALNNTIKELTKERDEALAASKNTLDNFNGMNSEEIKNLAKENIDLKNRVNDLISDNDKIVSYNNSLINQNKQAEAKLEQLEKELLERDKAIETLKTKEVTAVPNGYNWNCKKDEEKGNNKFTIEEIIKLLVALKKENLL